MFEGIKIKNDDPPKTKVIFVNDIDDKEKQANKNIPKPGSKVTAE